MVRRGVESAHNKRSLLGNGPLTVLFTNRQKLVDEGLR
jgi:hypothetical protein